METDTKVTKDRIEQTVSIDLTLAIEASEDEFNTLTVAAVRAGAEAFVKQMLAGGPLDGAAVYARATVGGYRYYPASARGRGLYAEEKNALTISLAGLLGKDAK